MKEHEKILKMIVSVSKIDCTDKLDEIDKRSKIWFHNLKKIKVPKDYDGENECMVYEPIGGIDKSYVWPPKGKLDEWFFHNSPHPLDAYKYRYTRSRDALKLIRPYGMVVEIVYIDGHPMALCYNPNEPFNGKKVFTTRGWDAPSEELAELHVIIQARAYQRGKNDTNK